MQCDWVVFRRGASPLSAFVATLGYSRASYVCFVTDERIATLLRCHTLAFEHFGGVPKQILYDNMKTVVIERDVYGQGQHKFQPAFIDFAAHHGFVPKLCRPYRAKTKGKVERFNGYLRRSFYNPLATKLKQLAGASIVLDCDTANTEVLRWLREVANVRIHATTGQSPNARLDEERKSLQTLPNAYAYIGATARAAPQAAQAAHTPNIAYTAHDTTSHSANKPKSNRGAVLAPRTPLQHPLSVYEALLECA